MIPRLRFAHLPTPIESMQRLSAELKGPHFFIKRDDQTGLAFGGNKARKLEFIVAEAQAQGAHTLVTVGGIQSNHCRQTAALAARYGFKCKLVLSGMDASMEGGNLLLDRLFGAEIYITSRDERDRAMRQIFDASWAAGERPYLIPLGASSATGALGYAAAIDEMLAQEIQPDWIVVASSSAGTQAGMILGARRAGYTGRILGISIDHSAADLKSRVAGLATEASERLGERIDFDPDEVDVNDQFLGKGYAVMGEPEREAIRLFGRLEGQVIGPVYTGRAAAGMIHLTRAGFFKETDTVLFWHTGDGPTLFSEPYARDINS